MGNVAKKHTKGKRVYKQKSILWTYVKKEMSILLKNPTFFIQCVLPAILIPIILGIYMFSFLKGEEGINIIGGIEELDATLTCTILGIMNFFSMTIYIAVTAVSRDGGNAKFMKYIPVPLYKQIRYKIIPSVLVNILPIIMCAVLAIYLFKGKVVEIVLVSIVATILSIIESYAMIIIDLKRPKLDWDTEQAVVKQNMNMLFQMLYGVVILGIIIYLAQALKDIEVKYVLAMMLSISTIAVLIIDRLIKKKADNLFEKIN